ncbi:MAG: phenylalanine--tRNA ligase subunit alpha, partial [Acidimicrobiales bacterium]
MAIPRTIRTLPSDQRSETGKAFNAARQAIEQALAERAEALGRSRLSRLDELEPIDVTFPGTPPGAGHLHVLTQVQREVEWVMESMGYTIELGPEVETDWYNFEALNMPPDHPARGMWDTLYLKLGRPETVLLRTHTSPVQIRLMESRPPPIYAVMPGRCYRRDTPDARHLPVFHQIEGLVVDRGISLGDLAGTIEAFTTAFFGPEIHSRFRPSYFPFTEPSAEFDITCPICGGSGCRTCSGSGWVELGGCGMVDPNVFAAVGIDAEDYSGFAFGFGIDRLAQMRAELPDMRTLLDNDLRFLTQF